MAVIHKFSKFRWYLKSLGLYEIIKECSLNRESKRTHDETPGELQCLEVEKRKGIEQIVWYWEGAANEIKRTGKIQEKFYVLEFKSRKQSVINCVKYH